jgi:N-acetylglutamate synthase-like GNAT family acetyltransferase
LVKFTVKQDNIVQYKILEDKKFVICGVYCCGMRYTDDAFSELLSILVSDDMNSTVNHSSAFVGLFLKKQNYAYD